MRAAKNPFSASATVVRFKAKGRSDQPGRFRFRPRHTKMFMPGEPVPETGIYEVVHDRGHREAHEVVMHGQDLFPACDQCAMRVRFRLVRTAPYIFDDEDFVEEQ